jgi:hypothetical protein
MLLVTGQLPDWGVSPVHARAREPVNNELGGKNMRKIFKLLLLVSLILFVSRDAFASDLSIVAAFYCDAEEMNESLVKECLAQYPELSGRISSAWEQWRKRNQEDAKKLR